MQQEIHKFIIRRDHHDKSRKESNRQLILTFLMALAIEIGLSLFNREKKTDIGEKGAEEHEKEVRNGTGKEEARKGGEEEGRKGAGEDTTKGGKQAPESGKDGGVKQAPKSNNGGRGKEAAKASSGAKGGATTGVVEGMAGKGPRDCKATAAAVQGKGVA